MTNNDGTTGRQSRIDSAVIAQPPTSGVRTSSRKWLKWLVVAIVLLATHVATAFYYANRYARGEVRVGDRPLTLDLSFDDWAAATTGADCSSYLRSAQNVAARKGVTIQVPGATPPRTEPFYYWGPGAPMALGWWLRLAGGHTMFTFFLFAVAAQVFFGVVAVATVNLYTRSAWALAVTAFCTGFCPPLQTWFYGMNLTSSEIVSLIPLSLLIFALAKGFIAYRAAPIGSWKTVISSRVLGWFGLAGVLIGLHSLVRDSGAAFATFIACFLIGRAVLADRRRKLLAVATAAIVLAGVAAVREPVKLWNQRRISMYTVCTSSEGAIWRYGLWMRHDQHDWFQSAGIGFGEYLDQDAATRVEDYYKAKRSLPELYSLRQLAQAVARRPADALAFKVSRLPVLWLGTDRWPKAQWGLVPTWCVVFYLLLLGFVGMRLWRRQRIPEPVFLYLLLIACASPLIHFEFRYTFPIWNTLVLVPGLLVAMLSRDGQYKDASNQAASREPATAAPVYSSCSA